MVDAILRFYIDSEKKKVLQLHVAQRPLTKGVLFASAARMLLATRRNPEEGYSRQTILPPRENNENMPDSCPSRIRNQFCITDLCPTNRYARSTATPKACRCY